MDIRSSVFSLYTSTPIARSRHQIKSSFLFHRRYIFLCCSNARNVTTVCGPNRTKLGTQPLNIHVKPSRRHTSLRSAHTPSFCWADMSRVLSTSTGLHTVVATNPAATLAMKCAFRSSAMRALRVRSDLNAS